MEIGSIEYWKSLTEWPGLGRKLRILLFPPNQGGCAFYRVINPGNKIKDMFSNVIDFRYNENPLNLNTSSGVMLENDPTPDIDWADIVWTNNLSNYGANYVARVCGLCREKKKLFHFDTDDLLTDLFEKHRLYGLYKEKNLDEITKFIYANSDLVTVTQRKFAERVKPYCQSGVLCMIKNAIDYSLPCWNGTKTMSPRKGMLRIGWVGGIHHEEDVKEFAGIPNLVNQKVGRENVFWGFYGRPPPDANDPNDWQQKVWDNYQKTLLAGFRGQSNWQIYPALPSDQYGYMFTNIDVAIAPLQMNEFNDSKSDIKVAECGRYRVPLVASNVGCYSDTIQNGKTGYLITPGDTKGWINALTKLIKDQKQTRQMGDNLHKITEEWFDLNKVVHERLNFYKFLIDEKGYKG